MAIKTVKVGSLRALHRHLSAVLDEVDGKTVATDNPPHTPGTPEPPAGADAAPVRSMNDAFPAMRGRHGVTADDLNRLNRR
jgi:hypothetical protein